MLSDSRRLRGAVLQQILGSSILIGMLFGVGCSTSKKSTPTPVLTVTKTHTGSFTQSQQNATYTVTVANTGTASTTGTVTVTETVPSGLTLVSMAGTGWTCAAGGTTCARADALANGSSYPVITVTVNVAASATSPQVNQVSVSGGNAANASGQDSTTIIVPALSITKSHTGNFQLAQVGAAYTITVSNGASAAPTNGTTVTVTDTAPSGLTMTNMSGTGWTCTTTSCNRTDVLAPGSSYPAITALVTVAANATTPQVNQVSVTGGGSANANASDSTTIDEPVLNITKTHTGNFNQGQTNATYTVTVSNTGTLPTTGAGVEVTDTVPSGETLVSMAGTGWTCPGLGGANTCDRSDVLAAGSSYSTITVTVNVAANASSPQVNQVSASGGGSATGNGSDSTTINSTDPCAGSGTGSESLLNGHYAFTLQGFDSGQGAGETTVEPALVGGVLTANGSGTITAGTLDMNLFSTAGVQSLSMTGTYKVGSDRRACLTFTTSQGSQHYRASLANVSSNIASTGHMIDFDAAGPFTSGELHKQDTTAFSTSKVTGNYAFEMATGQEDTVNSSGEKQAVAGILNLSAGNVTGGELDMNDGGTLDGTSAPTSWPNTAGATINSGTAAYTVDGATGRGTLTISVGTSPNIVTLTDVIYVVSAGDVLILTNFDQTQTNGIAAIGEALQQSGPFTLSGTEVIHLSGWNINGGLGNSGNPPASDALIGTIQISSPGNFTFFAWENSGGVIASQGPQTGTYSIDAAGRMRLTSGGGSNPPVFYLVSANKAFVLGGDAGVPTGMFEPQTATSISGAFSGGTIDPQGPNDSDNEFVVTFSSGTVSGTSDSNSNGSQSPNGSIPSTNVSIDGTGLGSIGSSGCTIGSGPTGCQLIFYVISATRGAIIELNSGGGGTQTNPELQIADQ